MQPSALSLFEYFAAAVKARSAESAIFFNKDGKWQSLSFSEVYSKAVSFGNELRSCGIRPADKIAIMLGNQPEWPIAFFAIQCIGCIAVPIDINLPPEDIKKQIDYSDARVVLATQRLRVDLPGLLPDVNIFLVDSQDFINRIKTSPAADDKEILKDIDPITDDTVAAMFYTSGTTAAPKAVMLTHKNLLSNLRSFRKAEIIKPGYVFISFLPLHHTYSFMVTCLVPILEGGHISYPSALNSEEIISCIKATKVNVVTGVPRFYDILHSSIESRLNKMPPLKRAAMDLLRDICWQLRKYFNINLSRMLFSKLHATIGRSLEYMISGGARLEPEVLYGLFKWGYTVLEGYGLTETSPVVTFNTPSDHRVGSAGRPIPEVRIRIMAPDASGVGEVAVSGANIMKGYYKQPEETARVIKDGWFLSGDLGHIDKDGYLYISGRKDQILVLGSGKKVNPEEMERHFSSSPYIKEVCVVISKGASRPAPAAGRLTAIVVPDEKYFHQQGHTDIEEMTRWVLEKLSNKLSPYSRIQELVLRKSPLPRTAMGKLMRQKISDEYQGAKAPSADRKGQPSDEDMALLSSEECKKILAFIAKYVKKDSVGLRDHLELDLGLDSLGRVELLMELGQFLNIQLSESQAMELFYTNTVKELILKAKPFLPDRPKY